MKLLKWGMACCMLVSVVAWQTKDTSFSADRHKRFYRRNAKAVCRSAGDKEER